MIHLNFLFWSKKINTVTEWLPLGPTKTSTKVNFYFVQDKINTVSNVFLNDSRKSTLNELILLSHNYLLVGKIPWDYNFCIQTKQQWDKLDSGIFWNKFQIQTVFWSRPRIYMMHQLYMYFEIKYYTHLPKSQFYWCIKVVIGAFVHR